jgi:ligand-binding sensor domain-containing protein
VDAEDVLWIGTHGGGLSRFQAGRFFNYRVKGGLPARSVGPMLEDDEGRLWMATDLGIVRVSRHELNEFAAGLRRSVNYVTFDRSDGLATIEMGGIQPACLKASDGKLWFGTAKGAAFMDPKELRVNPLPPPVIIEEVRIDDEVVEAQSSGVRGSQSEDGPAASGQSAIGNPQSTILRVQVYHLQLRL